MKKDLYAAREKNGIFLSAENFAGMESKLHSQKELIKDLEEKISANVVEMEKVCCLHVFCSVLSTAFQSLPLQNRLTSLSGCAPIA